MARANREINRLNSRPAPASDRENYIIGEMDLINRQLECEFCTRYVYYLCCFDCLLKNINFVGFVADHVGEKERVAERLEQETVENLADGPQHFW